MFRWARRSFSTDAGAPALLLAALPLDPASLELLVKAAQEPLPYVVLMPAESRAAIQVRGLEVDTLPLRALAVVAPSGRLAACRGSASPPVAFTVGADAAQPLRRRFEPVQLAADGEEESDAGDAVEDAGAAGEAGSAAAQAPVAAAAPSPAYHVELEEGWRLAIGQQVAIASLWRRFLVSLRRGAGRVFGADAAPCELQLALAPEDARRLQHLLRPGVRVLLLPR
jgi:hypothetical protein